MNGYDRIEKEGFWQMEEARQEGGRRRFRRQEVRRSLAEQRTEVRKKSFASRTQDPWNNVADHVKAARNPKTFRAELKKAWGLA